MKKIKTVILAVNPISGGIDKSNLITKVRQEVEKREASLFVFETTGKEDIINLRKKIREVDPCRIIVAGGDGTIKVAAEAVKDLEIPVGILPVGSANGLSVNLFLPDAIEEQLQIALGNSFKEIDIIVIDGEFCLHMGDLGLNAELIRKYEKSPVRGKLGYLLQTIPTLVESNYPFKFEVEVNESTFQREGILIAIANAQSYGTGAKVNPDGKMDDGKFEILIFKNFDMIEILKTLRNEVRLDPNFVEIFSAKKAKICCLSPVAFQVDGEYRGEKKCVTAEISPNKLLIAAPEKL